MTARGARGVALMRQRRTLNFASAAYENCFGNLPEAERSVLKKSTLDYMKSFDSQAWYKQPIATIIDGERLTEGKEETTVDAFQVPNGLQIVSPPETVDKIIAAARQAGRLGTDFREGVRKVEAEFEGPLAGEIIGNQSMDFNKQDGITEIEESVQANTVERRLNDLLVEEEKAGRVSICREPAIVGCVSNFTNFLDLFRKTIRNIETGVPVIILSREHTGQHMFRWVTLLIDLLKKHGVPPSLVTYASCDLPSKQKIMGQLPHSPAYFTCSRQVALTLKQYCPHLISSTEGPNTLVAEKMTPSIAEATRLSNLIENKGQCTALRHAVIPGATTEEVSQMYDDVKVRKNVMESIEADSFADIIENHTTTARSPPPGYSTHPSLPVAYKVGDSLPGKDMIEQWREVYIDVTSPPSGYTDEFVHDLCKWLNTRQPISCALNVPIPLALRIFDGSGLVVNTLGYPDEGQPAYTCQARPQDGECFGEFPPRASLTEHTKFPVHIPSATAGYNSSYNTQYLSTKATVPKEVAWLQPLVDVAHSPVGKGYLVELLEYLVDACQQNPKRGKTGPRSTLYGLQRSPIGAGDTIVRVGADVPIDTALASIVPLLATNARDALRVSVDPAHPQSDALRQAAGQYIVFESNGDFEGHRSNAYNVVQPAGSTPGASPTDYPLAALFVSTILPLGHVKSVRHGDEQFFTAFSKAQKWLRVEATAGSA